ncbi:hypothetical protein CHUAL_002429 [Chamberlinius hualienensis]
MGSSATSPNIAPHALSPQPASDADLKCSILQFNRDDTLNCRISKIGQSNDDSTSSTYSKAMFTKSNTTQITASLNQPSQKTTTDDSQNLSKTNSPKSDVNTKNLQSNEKDDKTKEDEDKYPCLRRALSCTETPILPLGTYAVEFGFDVCSLPFKSLSKQVPNLLNNQHRDTCRNRAGSKNSSEGIHGVSEKSVVCKGVIKDEQKELESEKSATSTSQYELLQHTKDTEMSIHSKSYTTHTSTTGNFKESARMISPKRLKRDGQKEENQEDWEIKCDGSETALVDNEHSASVAKSSKGSVNSEEGDQPDSEPYDVYEESYWYATKWKKDNRKWLWKCSRRTRHEILACNAMSRKYRRTDNLWLTKPSSKQS